VSGWEEQAACRGTDQSIWFPEVRDALTAVQQARRICVRCPVWDVCLEQELAMDGPDHGIRAGLSAKTRSRIKAGELPRPVEPPQPKAIIAKPRKRKKKRFMEPTPIRPVEPPKPAAPPKPAEPARPESLAEPTAVELIAFGEGHDVARLRHVAARAKDALAQLAEAMERETKVSEAEGRIARLKAQLQNAELDLRSAKGTTAPAVKRKDGGSETAKIRAWAIENGHDVKPVGLVPADVVQAYHRAHAA
jgi:hypothetical protein